MATSTVEPREDRNSLGKAAFVIGVIGLVVSFIPIIGFVAWLLCPLAILFGLVALRRPSKSLAIVGIVTGLIGLFICYQWIAGTKAVGDAMNADTFNSTGESKDLSSAPILDASVAGLWKEIEANKVAAGQKYGGKRIRFSDEKIADFSGDAERPAIQVLGKSEQYINHFVSVSFEKVDGAKIAGMSKGDRVTFVCEDISETFGDGYSLSQCALQ